MGDIFISYSSSDKERVEPIVQLLKEQGWSVWWDRIIPPGKRYDEVIEEALNASKCVVVVWTKNSIASQWVRTEADEGEERNALVPVLLDDVKIPLEFRRIQAAKLFDWRGEATSPEAIKFLASVSSILGAPPVVPPPKETQKRLLSAGLMLKVGAALVSAILLALLVWKFRPQTQPQPQQQQPIMPNVNSTAVTKKSGTVEVLYLDDDKTASIIASYLTEDGYKAFTTKRRVNDAHPSSPQVRWYFEQDEKQARAISDLIVNKLKMLVKPESRVGDPGVNKAHSPGEFKIYLD